MDEVLIKSFDYAGDPVDIFELFSNEPFACFLDSHKSDLSLGRYSFIAFDPFEVFSSSDEDCLDKMRERFLRYKNKNTTSLLPLTSGMIGYLGYELGLKWEKIKTIKTKDISIPDCFFGFYDCVISVDHAANKLYVASTGLPETEPWLREQRKQKRLDYVLKKISQNEHIFQKRNSNTEKISIDSRVPSSIVKSNLTQPEYFKAVHKILDYIQKGDVYQVNLSQRFVFDTAYSKDDVMNLYKILREISPTHFGSFFNASDFQIISNSPERFLQLKKGQVQTRPMKGTRPRIGNLRVDEEQKKDLLNSDKDKAELLMVTDLERNDLGRVCAYGSVKVKHMRTLEEYTTVYQATSTVEGKLRKDKDCFDLLRACFPGGSITGCPKIRSMEIIEELEPNQRGIYTGSLGYINFAGDLDFNILIRTMLLKNNKIYFHVGGGIVADSIPQKEYEETLIKARALLNSLDQTFFSPKEIIQR